MKLLVSILLSICSFLPGVQAHVPQESMHGFPKHFYTLLGDDVDNLQSNQAVVSKRRSSGERRANDESAEREEESKDDDDDDESKSLRRHTGPGSSYISSHSGAETDSAAFLLNHLLFCGHLAFFSSPRFIIHCVFRL